MKYLFLALTIVFSSTGICGERPSCRNPAPLGAGQGSNEISDNPYPSRISSLQGGVPQTTSWIDSYRHWNKANGELKRIEKPIITFFGSGKMEESNPYYKQAHTLAKQLANQGFVIVTGGNQGIMKAANCGALEVPDKGITSISINIEGLNVANTCAQKILLLKDFSFRKKLMMEYATAFVIFPGGIGTLDELSELVTLMATHNLAPKPIFIVGQEYWHYLKQWFELGVKQGLITEEAMNLMTFTDDIEVIAKDILRNIHFP